MKLKILIIKKETKRYEFKKKFSIKIWTAGQEKRISKNKLL